MASITRARFRNRAAFLVLAFALIILLVGGICYLTLVRAQSRIIEHEAIRIAEVVTHQALSSRSVFATLVADKLSADGFGSDENYQHLRGFVPLPAQYLKHVAHHVRDTNQGLYSYTPLSKWNQDPRQGLHDDFQRWAWQQLEQQDQAAPKGPIPWRPVWRYETIDGRRMLRYMSADPAVADNCVSCHNALEKRPETVAYRQQAHIVPGKQWRLNQLMGALEVDVPVDRVEAIANRQSRVTLVTVVSTTLAGVLVAALLALWNIRRERVASAYFEQRAKLDPLTGLLNRSGFDEAGHNLILRLKRDQCGLNVFFIDLDGFKDINDTYGHRAGDELLKQAAERIRQILREADIIARQGGDEFLVLVEDASSAPQVETVAQKILDTLSQPFTVDGHEVTISASIGISRYSDHSSTMADMIKQADLAMYAAKKAGRARYHIYHV